MFPQEEFDYEKHIRSKKGLTLKQMTSFVDTLLRVLRKKCGENGSNYSIYQHLIWFREDGLENIVHGVFSNGLWVKNPCISSTTNITGNLSKISAEDVLSYRYDCSIDYHRHNLGFIIPKTIVDEKGRRINLSLDEKPKDIRWNEGYHSSMIDFLLSGCKSLPNVYSLFHFDLYLPGDEFGYRLNTNALPFLPKEKQRAHELAIAKLIKNTLVFEKKVLTEEEYDKAKDINPYIEKLIADTLAVTTGPYIDPAYWEFP